MQNLKILQLNVDGLGKKIEEIKNLIFEESLDILCLTETKLTKNISNSRVQVQGYDFLRLDRKHKMGGGLLVYYKKSYNIYQIEHKSEDTKGCECLIFSVKLGTKEDAIFILAYRPPNENKSVFLETLDHFFFHYIVGRIIISVYLVT